MFCRDAFGVLLWWSFPWSVVLAVVCLFTCSPFLVHQMSPLLSRPVWPVPVWLTASALSHLARPWQTQVAMIFVLSFWTTGFIMLVTCVMVTALHGLQGSSWCFTTLALGGQQGLKFWWNKSSVGFWLNLQEVLDVFQIDGLCCLHLLPVLPLKKALYLSWELGSFFFLPSCSLNCFEMLREDFRIYQQLNFWQLNSQQEYLVAVLVTVEKVLDIWWSRRTSFLSATKNEPY